MGTLIIGAGTFEVMNDDLVSADTYVEGSVGPGADAWNALDGDDDAQGRLLVQATRILFNLKWKGTKTDSAQRTAFPRDGATDFDGVAITDGTVPQDLKDAEIELAMQLAVTPTLPNATDAGSNVQRVKAGPVEIEFFKATTGNDLAIMLPKPVWDLISGYLSSATSVARSTVSGTSCESHFDNCGSVYPYTRNGPF